MKKIKKMLIDEANKQEIHDLHNEILRKVDQTKVRNDIIFASTLKRRSFLLPKLAVGAMAAGLLIFAGISIGWVSNNPNERVVEKPTENEKFDIYDSDSETILKYLAAVSKQEAYNIINIAPSLNNIDFNVITLDSETKKMTESERIGLVNDLHFQIYNITEMLGLDNIEVSRESNPYKSLVTNPFSNYNEKLSVTGPLSSYELYFTEDVKSQKNVGEVNLKIKADMEGKINAIDNIYAFSGNMEYKNGKTIYTTSIAAGEYSVNVKEIFGSGLNEFRYEYNRIKNNLDGTTDVELLREINIKQDFDALGNIKKVEFSNDYTSLYVEKKNVNDANIITFKVSGRNSEELTVRKTNEGYSYTFKNSPEFVYDK